MLRLALRARTWLALAAGLFVCARSGLGTGILGGLSVGFAVGGLYLWLLLRRTSTLSRLPPRQAVAAAQFAAVLRFCFVFAAFAAAARVWPEAELAWGAGAFLVPLALSMFAMARGA